MAGSVYSRRNILYEFCLELALRLLCSSLVLYAPDSYLDNFPVILMAGTVYL